MTEISHLSLHDQVIVVTGGAGLLGKAFCAAIADAGGIAIIADVDETRGAQAVADLTAACAQRRVEFVRADIADAESLDLLFEGVRDRHGRLDGLVNNAYPRNANYGRRVEDVTYSDFVENLGSHVAGYFLCSQRFVASQRAHGVAGTIVNLGSIYGVMAPRFDIYDGTHMTMPVEYSAIKASVIHLTRYFAQYLKGDAIRVNCLSPGGIYDNQPESFVSAYRQFASDKGMLAPEDLTGALLFLLSSASRYINGQNIIVDDGWTL